MTSSALHGKREARKAWLLAGHHGPMNVARAVLPVMRAQRDGHVLTISSLAGQVGTEFTSAYALSKFAVEGWMEALHHDIKPYNTAPRS
ncbi:SDR family NAD(P)-dependent oxidoreductase [Streptomyces massasporeus]|uniref:SDR family NAD(P)-dependent oxidoreductase n=1 Tax=Streptomyces massasporeus TaxID=67324 RepID=UPI0033D1006F